MATPGTVLLVEDDDTIREGLAELLRDEGYQVAEAAHGRAALDWLQHNPRPCLILLDLYMPVMSGIAFRAKQLTEPALAAIPVVVVSAIGGETVEALHVAQSFVKPVDVGSLLACIGAHCCVT